MANPQKENGFTPIANEILEATAGASLNGTQLRILLLLWRNSYGFHQHSCPLPLSYLAKMLRGSKSTIARQVKKLEFMGVISVVSPEKQDGHTPKSYAFNKDYAQWLCGAGPVGLTTQHMPPETPRVCRTDWMGNASWRTDKYRNINKYNSDTKKNSRYDFEKIERQTFLNVTNGNYERRMKNE